MNQVGASVSVHFHRNIRRFPGLSEPQLNNSMFWPLLGKFDGNFSDRDMS